MKPNELEVQKKIYGDMRKFAKESKLKKLRDMHAPKHPMVHVSIATGTHPPAGHPLDGMADDELEELTKKKNKKEEDAEGE